MAAWVRVVIHWTSGIAAKIRSAPEPGVWMRDPRRRQWQLDPLALDCAFQMLIVWSWRVRQAPSLPTGMGKYRQFVKNVAASGGQAVRAVARITRQSAAQAWAEVDFLDEKGRVLARLEEYECVIDAGLAKAFKKNQIALA